MRPVAGAARALVAAAVAAVALFAARSLLVGLRPSIDAEHPAPAILLASFGLGAAFVAALALRSRAPRRS